MPLSVAEAAMYVIATNGTEDPVRTGKWTHRL